MAPSTLDVADDRLRAVIQDLYEIQSATHGYLGPETQQVLIRKIQDLTQSLAQLTSTASSLPTQVPPEVIDYVDTGRNPDIYTREFVELVQRSNSHLKGKREALTEFRDVYAKEISNAWPEFEGTVKEILEGEIGERNGVSKEGNGANGFNEQEDKGS